MDFLGDSIVRAAGYCFLAVADTIDIIAKFGTDAEYIADIKHAAYLAREEAERGEAQLGT